MPVVLTGDVHHAIESGDQRFTNRSEAALAVDYARIAAQYDLKVTLFFTGRAIVENGSDAKDLLTMDSVEIGGHGWDALRPRWWHRSLNLLIGSPHGPSWLQRQMIQRTCTIIEQYTGQAIQSWRNHAYRHDKHTPRLLTEAGISVWSDEVNFERLRPYRHEGITVLPINITPDHEHMYHGARTRSSIPHEERSRSLSPAAWLERVSADVRRVAEAGGVAALLVHPICMKITDNFATFERLCRVLSGYPSLFASEVPECTR